jgi:hypothetical protein
VADLKQRSEDREWFSIITKAAPCRHSRIDRFGLASSWDSAAGAWLRHLAMSLRFIALPALLFRIGQICTPLRSVFDLLSPPGFDSAELMLSFYRKPLPVKSRNRRSRVSSNRS